MGAAWKQPLQLAEEEGDPQRPPGGRPPRATPSAPKVCQHLQPPPRLSTRFRPKAFARRSAARTRAGHLADRAHWKRRPPGTGPCIGQENAKATRRPTMAVSRQRAESMSPVRASSFACDRRGAADRGEQVSRQDRRPSRQRGCGKTRFARWHECAARRPRSVRVSCRRKTFSRGRPRKPAGMYCPSSSMCGCCARISLIAANASNPPMVSR